MIRCMLAGYPSARVFRHGSNHTFSSRDFPLRAHLEKRRLVVAASRVAVGTTVSVARPSAARSTHGTI